MLVISVHSCSLYRSSAQSAHTFDTSSEYARFHEARYKLSDSLNEISEFSGRKKLLQLSETLLLAPSSDDVTKKEGKLIKEAFFQFISDTKVKI